MVIILLKFGFGIYYCIIVKIVFFIMVYKYSFNILNKSMKEYGNVFFLYEVYVLFFFGFFMVLLLLLCYKLLLKYCVICF